MVHDQIFKVAYLSGYEAMLRQSWDCWNTAQTRLLAEQEIMFLFNCPRGNRLFSWCLEDSSSRCIFQQFGIGKLFLGFTWNNQQAVTVVHKFRMSHYLRGQNRFRMSNNANRLPSQHGVFAVFLSLSLYNRLPLAFKMQTEIGCSVYHSIWIGSMDPPTLGHRVPRHLLLFEVLHDVMKCLVCLPYKPYFSISNRHYFSISLHFGGSFIISYWETITENLNY